MALPSFQYSGVSYAGQPAGTTTFALTTSGGKSIGYLLPSHVHVYSSTDNGTTLVELTRPAQWDFNPARTAVVLKTGIASGVAIVLQRITPQDAPYTEFAQGTLLTADQLNDATIFNLYITQESDDQVEAGVADAALALGQSATALSQSTIALGQSTDAMVASGTALSEASQALSTANGAKATAEGAATVSGVAIQRADSSLAQSSNAATVSADADAKATAALAAVADASIYVTVANVAALPPAPTDAYKAQVADSTGVESSAGVAGLPAGFVGDAGIFVRLNYNAATSKWQYASYGANDPDNRYAKSPLPVASTSAAGIVRLSSAVDSTSQAVAATASAVKTVSDAAAAASSTAASAASAASAAQATADAALPKAGGTMTGDIVFSPNQAKATTSGTFGITTLSDSTSNTSSTTAATSRAIKDTFDVAFAARTTALAAEATANAALPKAGGTMTGNLTVPSINAGPLAGFRNAIINGNFDHWQRATTITTNAYGADRWFHTIVGTTHTATRQPFTVGQTAVPNEPTYFCRTVVSSVAGAGNVCNLQQRIEGVRSLAGQQVTASFWAKADAVKPIAVEFIQTFGTGGSPSADVTGIGTTKVTLSTSWQKITVTANVPSISGKTLGTANDDHIRMNIWFDAGSNFNARTNTLGQQSGTFDIAQVQIEAGPVATPFERRPIGTELSLCQRYHERSYYWIPTTGVVGVGNWSVQKRAVPTIAIVSYNVGSGGTVAALGGTGFVAGTYATTDARVVISGDAEL